MSYKGVLSIDYRRQGPQARSREVTHSLALPQPSNLMVQSFVHHRTLTCPCCFSLTMAAQILLFINSYILNSLLSLDLPMERLNHLLVIFSIVFSLLLLITL